MPQVGGGYIGRPFQINHLAMWLEEIEFTFPICPHGENICAEFPHICDFLFPILFGEYFIHTSQAGYDFTPIRERNGADFIFHM